MSEPWDSITLTVPQRSRAKLSGQAAISGSSCVQEAAWRLVAALWGADREGFDEPGWYGLRETVAQSAAGGTLLVDPTLLVNPAGAADGTVALSWYVAATSAWADDCDEENGKSQPGTASMSITLDPSVVRFCWNPSVWSDDDIWRAWSRVFLVDATAPEEEKRVDLRWPEYGERVALRGDEYQFTYRDLLLAGDELKHELTGSRGPRRIGVYGDADPRVFLLCAGAYAAGAAFVPLDPALQAERLEHIAEDADLSLVVDVAVTDSVGRRPTFTCRVLSWDEFSSSMHEQEPPSAVDTVEVPGSALAYIIYTSGSSGKPKGVCVSRGALGELAAWGADLLDLKAGDPAGQTANSSFDASVWEVWPGLYAGALLNVASATTRRDPVLLQSWMVDRHLRVSFSPTPVAELLSQLDWPDSNLEVLGAGGAALHAPAKPQRFQLLNLYGPTEATSVSSFCFVDPASRTNPTIGVSTPFSHIRVVDRGGREVPAGEVGELWISGRGLANGYVGDEPLTSARFVCDPSGDGTSRAYRSGDRGRLCPDGELEFLGRLDRQVKISGVRMELGEIESVALEVAGVKAAAAGVNDQGRLVLFLLTSAEDPASLCQHVRSVLPTAAANAKVLSVRGFPLTGRGKVDVATLLSWAEEHRSA